MTARELNVLFEKYGIGHVKLEKPFEDSMEIHAIVVDDNGVPLGSSDRWHFNSIEINDNTFGFESDKDITDEDYDSFMICDLQFYTTSWAYPRANINECGGGIEVAESNCGIRLVDYKQFENRESDLNLYVEQAIKMFQDPLVYQNWLLGMFLEEQTKFIEKHYQGLKEMGYWMAESGIYKRGFENEYTSEIHLEFKTITGVSDLFLHQDLFTGRLVLEVSRRKDYKVKSLEDPCQHWEYNVNDLSVDELKKYIEEKFKKTGESFWREEKEYREKYNQEHGFDHPSKEDYSPYNLDMFLKYKTGRTQSELLLSMESENPSDSYR